MPNNVKQKYYIVQHMMLVSNRAVNSDLQPQQLLNSWKKNREVFSRVQLFIFSMLLPLLVEWVILPTWGLKKEI